MIGWRERAIVSNSGPSVAPQITPFPTGRIMSTHYQAFHAWLPSFRPSGTKVRYLMLTQMGGCRTTASSSAVVLSFASRILHSSHFLGRQIEAATKQPIKMTLIGEASQLGNFGNG